MCEFSAHLELPYDVRFMETSLSWATGLITLAGGVQKEAHALRLALDETLTFLIDSYPEAESWERIRVEFQLRADGVAEIDITNAGPPVHPERIPHYVPDSHLESDVDGLWYFLASGFVDELTFSSRGKDGWGVMIRKGLAEPTFEPKVPGGGQDAALAGKIKFSTRLAVPEDAVNLVNLTYDTFRYSYVDEDFYSETKLCKALAQGEIISLLVEADGVIVGNSSFALSPEMPRRAYSGSLMVKPAFRQSRAIIHLLNEVTRFMDSGQLDADLYFATMVTAHTGSQKAGARVGWKPLALHLSAAPVVDFRGIKFSHDERESLVTYVRLASPMQLPVLYLPQRHHVVMAGLLAQAGFDSALSAQEAAPSEVRTRFVEKVDAAFGCATLTVSQVGQDFAERLTKKLFSVRGKGIETVMILVPAWHPLPPDLEAVMGRINGFFTGVEPVSARECYLLYCVLSASLDFERIRIQDPLAQELKGHCRRLYEELVAEDPE